MPPGKLAISLCASSLALLACGGNDDEVHSTLSCAELAQAALPDGTRITLAQEIRGGEVTPNGAAQPLPAHCHVQGRIHERVGPVDGKPYHIGFDLRLPAPWNGRFFFQGGGGSDGAIVPAYGTLSGGGQTTNALTMGYAVVSTDGGHLTESGVPVIGASLFGLDPQARVDYGYNAVGQTTTSAKALIEQHYGKAPDRSYFVGCSNGGRQAMKVAAARFADEFDGVIAGNPGFNLPQSGLRNPWEYQAFATAAPRDSDGRPIVALAFPPADLELVARRVVQACDALDGLADGMVDDLAGCQASFRLADLSCSGAKTPDCLTATQVAALDKAMDTPRNSQGDALYVSFPYDAGIGAAGWRSWRLGSSTTSVPNGISASGASGPYIFSTPPLPLPASPLAVVDALLAYDFDVDAAKIYATDATYTESPMSFMSPPNPTDLGRFARRGGRMIVFHGGSDPVFSIHDTIRWYEALQPVDGRTPDSFARLFNVPGMTHCSGGPATDQFDTLSALVDWVEHGRAPDRILASARAANRDAAAWLQRTRPLCPFPKSARYTGTGDIDRAENFDCR